MDKGEMGIKLKTYAIIAFVLAIFGQMLLSGLLLAFVMVKEKDEWTKRQCMQGFFLTFASSVIGVIAIVLGALGWMITAASYGRGVGAMIAFLIVPVLLWILVLVFEIIALVNVSKGREANVPLVSQLAYRAFGYVQQRQAPAQQAGPYTQNYNPNYNYQGYQPQQPPMGQPQQPWPQQQPAPQQAWQPPAPQQPYAQPYDQAAPAPVMEPPAPPAMEPPPPPPAEPPFAAPAQPEAAAPETQDDPPAPPAYTS